jgi:hypothetical protein
MTNQQSIVIETIGEKIAKKFESHILKNIMKNTAAG